jgi:parvulin-like peptidyl-prolyl isomerase
MQNNPPSSTRRVRPARESKSATVRAAAAAPSRRQLSHWQREQHQRRLLYIGVGALVVVVAAIFAAGLIYDNVYRANQVVAQVGPDSITATQLLDEIRPQARALDAQAKQVGGGTSSDQIASYLDSQKRALPDSVLNDLIDTHIVQQEATRRGISVTPAEVDDKERQTIAEFQASKNPAPTPAPTEAPEASPTAAITSATPELTVLPVAAALTPTALTTPTAVPTLEADAYTTALQQFVTQNNVTEADLRTQIERSLLQDKIQAAIGQQQVPATQAQVHARQIVVATSDQANDLLNQLKNGADFAQLAQQNSTDTVTRDKGGDMGWFARGVQTKAIEDAAFSLQPGQLSDVISDGGSYHILQVIESDPNRSLPPDQLTNQRQKAFQDWLSSKRSGQDVKLSLDQSQKDWLLARIGVRP